MIKRIILPLLIIFSLQSCNILEKKICSNYMSDEFCFRSHANAISTNSQLSQEKALMIAKKNISEEVDIYILDKFSYESFLEDPEFEAKLTAARKTMLSDINIVCSRTIPKRDSFKSFIAIEISKETIDTELNRRLKDVTQ